MFKQNKRSLRFAWLLISFSGAKYYVLLFLCIAQTCCLTVTTAFGWWFFQRIMNLKQSKINGIKARMKQISSSRIFTALEKEKLVKKLTQELESLKQSHENK